MNTSATMTTTGQKLRFRIGLILIGASYPLWGAALLLGAQQLRSDGFPWWILAAASMVLNWILFSMGILIAGREAASYFKTRTRAMFKRLLERNNRGIVPKTDKE